MAARKPIGHVCPYHKSHFFDNNCPECTAEDDLISQQHWAHDQDEQYPGPAGNDDGLDVMLNTFNALGN